MSYIAWHQPLWYWTWTALWSDSVALMSVCNQVVRSLQNPVFRFSCSGVKADSVPDSMNVDSNNLVLLLDWISRWILLIRYRILSLCTKKSETDVSIKTNFATDFFFSRNRHGWWLLGRLVHISVFVLKIYTLSYFNATRLTLNL